jgi:hypothetical protein
MSDRAPGNAEMRTPAILSVGVHVFAIAATIVNFNFFSSPPMEREPIMVEFEAIAIDMPSTAKRTEGRGCAAGFQKVTYG